MIRAFQWDLARQVERLDWLLAQLPRYAEWGYRELYLHLEDAVDYPSLPGVARADAYSHRDVGRLVDAAQGVGIGVVPIVNLLGHTQYLIKVPELRDLNELRHPDGSPQERGQLCPLHPRTLEIANRLFDDVAPFCTAGKIHVGLDESFQLGRHPRSRAEIAEIGLAAHFASYATRLHASVSARGLKLGMWADMLALLPEAIPLLPRGISAYDWYYYPFRALPRMELYNFREYDLVPTLRAQGIDYWGCPMNGAFRFEPLPIFGERMQNLRAWWRRCQQVEAAGFLVTSWEAYRLAIETTTVVDAAAASLWTNPEADDAQLMLAKGFARLEPLAPSRTVAQWTRHALACDRYPFSGYARWEIGDRWDGTSTRESFARFAAEARFFGRLAPRELPPAFAASVAFRRYLAERDVFVRSAARGVWKLRRLLTKGERTPVRALLSSLRTQCTDFAKRLRVGQAAADAMWRRTREANGRGQNARILESDLSRLLAWRRWLVACGRKPSLAHSAAPVCGRWQLQLMVHSFAPALQKIVVEQQAPDGAWRELGGRFTIEFRAEAARPRTRIRREFAVPVEDPHAALRVAVRGLGQVGISHLELTDGVVHLRPLPTPDSKPKEILGQPAPKRGFPMIDWSANTGAVVAQFLPQVNPSEWVRPTRIRHEPVRRKRGRS